MKRLEDFQKLKEAFDTKVLRVYDRRLKGNYFIHQFEPNKDGKGIDYNTGGRELAQNGAQLIVPAVSLFAGDVINLSPRIKKEYHGIPSSDTGNKERLSNEIRMISGLEIGVKSLSEEVYQSRHHSYLDVYPAISYFSEQIPQEYRQGLGEMIFHQLRLLNMCGLGEVDPLQFHGLDMILHLIPDKDFLSRKKIRQLGEGLVREVLKSKNGCRSSAEARQAIQEYRLTNRDLTIVVKDMGSIESEFERRINRVKEALEEQKEDYIAFRKTILSKIGEDMHTYDYRE